MNPDPTLAWATDIHLDQADVYRDSFGDEVRATGAEALILTGDLSERSSLFEHLAALVRAAKMPVYFVLGNHDLYRGYVADAHAEARRLHTYPWAERGAGAGRAIWLREAGVVQLADGIALVGVDGLYDAGYGTPFDGTPMMTDFQAIWDLRGLNITRIVETVQGWATESAAIARQALRSACSGNRRVIFATHVPPFPAASNYRGASTPPALLPWYASRSMGEVLIDVATEFPDTQILVLCGHCHATADVEMLPNLRVACGKALYGTPTIANRIQGLTILPAYPPEEHDGETT